MRTVSTTKPTNRFVIERLNGNKCTVLFFDNVTELKSGLFEFEFYRLPAIYRPTLEKTINGNYEAWLNQAKELEKPVETVIEVPKESEENLDLKEELFLMQHRMMKMEIERNRTSVLSTDHYEKSPYTLAKVLIENDRLNYSYMLELLSDFVNNKYMMPDEFTELIYLMDEHYNKL